MKNYTVIYFEIIINTKKSTKNSSNSMCTNSFLNASLSNDNCQKKVMNNIDRSSIKIIVEISLENYEFLGYFFVNEQIELTSLCRRNSYCRPYCKKKNVI